MKNMESNHLNNFFLLLLFLFLTIENSQGQNCMISESSEDVNLVNQGILFKEIQDAEKSNAYLSVIYIITSFKSEGYKLDIDSIGGYKLYFITKDQSTLLKIGKFNSDKENAYSLSKLQKTGIYISRCQSSISSNALSVLLIKQKNSILKIYSLDSEMEKTLIENKREFTDAMIKFNLLRTLQNT